MIVRVYFEMTAVLNTKGQETFIKHFKDTSLIENSPRWGIVEFLYITIAEYLPMLILLISLIVSHRNQVRVNQMRNTALLEEYINTTDHNLDLNGKVNSDEDVLS